MIGGDDEERFVEQLGIGSAILAGRRLAEAAQNEHEGHRPLTGPLASCGQLRSPAGGGASKPRWTERSPARLRLERPRPSTVERPRIKEGGSVNFVLAGFHQVLVYAPPTKPDDIDTSALLPIPGAPPPSDSSTTQGTGSIAAWIHGS